MEKKAAEIHKRYKKAREKRQLKDGIWHELDAFDRGEQWEITGKIPPWVPKPVTNFVHLVKTTKRAAFAMENPTGKLRAISPQDIEMIDQLQKVYEFEWERMKARKVVRQNIETAKLLGDGIAQVYWDENVISGGTGGLAEGLIRVKEVDPASFYPDPSAFEIEDCQFIHIVERKPVDWLKKHPVFGAKMNEVEERKLNPSDTGEIYNREYGVGSDGLVDFHQHFEKKQNEAGGFTYSVTYLAGEVVVHEVEQLRPNRYPFARLKDFPQRHDFWSLSTCQLILDNQKLVNKVESIIAMIGTMMQNPQKIISRESGINPGEMARSGNEPGKTWVANGDPSKAVMWQQPPQIPPSLFNLADQAKQNIREITGMNEAYMGQNVGSLQTSSGVESLIERATMRDRDQMYEIEQYVEELSRIVVAFIAEYYTTTRYIRILGDNQEQVSPDMFQMFIGSDFRDLEFDFFMDVSAKAPITRMRQQQELKELLNMQLQYQPEVPILTTKEYIRLNKMVDADRLIKRMEFDEMNSKTQQAMELANMMFEAMSNGVPPEEVMQMGEAMAQQQMEMREGKLGSTSNSNNVQMAQQGVQ